MVAQLTQQTAFGGTERLAEDVIPGIPHQLQQRGGVPIRNRSLYVKPNITHETACLGCRPILVDTLELAVDERSESAFEQLQPLADPFMIGDRHIRAPP